MRTLVIEICMGTACHLLGAQDIIDAVETLPAAQRDRIELRGATCLKTCRKGPNVRVNGVVLSEMTPDRMLTVIADNMEQY